MLARRCWYIGLVLMSGITLTLVLLYLTSPITADSMHVEDVDNESCIQHGGVWDSATSTCRLDNWTIDGYTHAVIEEGEKYDIAGTLRIDYDIIGPRGGAPIVGMLLISGEVHSGHELFTYGLVENLGQLTTDGIVETWIDSWYSCNHHQGTCIDIPIEGEILNRSAMTNAGIINVVHLLSNQGTLVNSGSIHIFEQMVNSGLLINDGTIDVTGWPYLGGRFENSDVFRNQGAYLASGSAADINAGTIHNTGRLEVLTRLDNRGVMSGDGDFVVHGTLWNWGIISADVVTNTGVILNLGTISSTVVGDGQLIHLTDGLWFPAVARP